MQASVFMGWRGGCHRFFCNCSLFAYISRLIRLRVPDQDVGVELHLGMRGECPLERERERDEFRSLDRDLPGV